MKTFAPAAASVVADSPDRASSQDWLQHSTPGLDIPFEAFEGARRDWAGFRARPARAAVAWVPLGPTYGKSPFNPYRDRSVYNAGTDNFGGRTIHAVISPDCTDAACTLWIANANGGVWRTKNALVSEPAWEYISDTFEHNNIGSLALDPNDPTHQTLWAGTGEPNACGSGCEAGVGVYRSRNGGDTWSRVMGKDQFNGRAVGSMAVKPGNSNVIFAASGRGIRGLSNTCCGGADALIPGAPHFGLYRSVNAGRTWSLVHQGAVALCTVSTPDQVSLNQTPCAARGARRVAFDPVDPNTVYVSYFSRGIWRSQQNGDPGTWEQIMAPVGPIGTTERPEFDVVELPSGETRMYVGVGGGVQPGWLWTGREHVFRSTNYGRAAGLSIAKHRQHCNVWTGDGDIDEDGTYEPATDLCDDWQPLGASGSTGRLTNASYGADRTGGHVALVERAKNDSTTLWAATSTGRVFISTNAGDPSPAAVAFTRLDSLAPNDPPRYPTAVFVDPEDANHAWIAYSGFNAKTPDTPGHVFEIRFYPPMASTTAGVTFTNLDGTGRFPFGDIPANSIIVSERGTIYVGTDFGVVQRGRFIPGWHRTAPGLPNTVVADLVLVPERDVLYAATHGQGVWQLNVR